MSIADLYQDSIKQHSQNPVGANRDFPATHFAEGYNANCGDELDIYCRLSSSTPSQQLQEIGFKADACAICVASASLMCAESADKSSEQLLAEIDQFESALKSDTPMPDSAFDCLLGVKAHRSRINCALLPWQTLRKALTEAGLANG